MQIDLDRIDRHFPTIYVMLISVLLGLALEDLLSLLRSVDIIDPWVWIVGVSLLTFYVYNAGMLRKLLPYETSFANYSWPVLTLVPHVVGFPVIGLLSLQGRLSVDPDLIGHHLYGRL